MYYMISSSCDEADMPFILCITYSILLANKPTRFERAAQWAPFLLTRDVTRFIGHFSRQRRVYQVQGFKRIIFQPPEPYEAICQLNQISNKNTAYTYYCHIWESDCKELLIPE